MHIERTEAHRKLGAKTEKGTVFCRDSRLISEFKHMYKEGELIVYGTTGVCRVEKISTLDGMGGTDANRLYYILRPLYQNGTIYSPVDSKKIPIRPVISRDEAERLIAMIPNIKAEAYTVNNIQLLAEHYKELLQSQNCEGLIELAMSIYTKKQYIEQQKRKFGQIDETYLKRAEELLFGELAVALDIPKDKVKSHIFEGSDPALPNN